jgi:hypothetical protein
VIDYALPQGFRASDAGDSRWRGKVVRKYASNDAPEATMEELSKQLIPLYWLRMPKTLPATPGMHRWVWDLHYTTPTATTMSIQSRQCRMTRRAHPQGPLALPGTYTVRLTAGGKVLTAPLTIKIDPRVHATPADLQSLFASAGEQAGRDGLKERFRIAEVHSAQEQLRRCRRSALAPIKDAIEKLDKELGELLSGQKKPGGGEQEPGSMMCRRIGRLVRAGWMADAAPTAAQLKAADHASEELTEVLKRWQHSKDSSIPALNRQLEAAHCPR